MPYSGLSWAPVGYPIKHQEIIMKYGAECSPSRILIGLGAVYIKSFIFSEEQEENIIIS